MTYSDRYMEERAAVLAYKEAFDARVSGSLRRGPDGLIIDDPKEDARLARNLAHAAQRWKRALETLGCPLPPGLEAEAAGTL
jgi:hypothetical protein